MAFELAKLPYAFDALEPHIDAKTMEIHHDKHHAAYTNNLNAAIEGTDLANATIEEILAKGTDKPAVRNNGGGFYNHNLFWEILTPGGSNQPTAEVAEAIDAAFGSFEAFKDEFSKAAATRFGSGWAWLVVKEDGSLAVTSTANQDNPLMPGAEVAGMPILGIDVWEHAYYLKYQNKRDDYLKAFNNVLDWKQVEENYKKAK